MAEARCGWFDRFLPVITDVGVPRLGADGAKLGVDAVALRQASPSHWRREAIEVFGYGGWPIELPHPQAVRMGDLLVTGGQLAVSQAHEVHAPYELGAQTPVVMQHLEHVLEAGGMRFSDVIKATTHYRGGANAEDLHENMVIRSSFYTAPGPASTGVPVTALPAAAAMISIELTAVK
jgi:enamine deaminase RidA (YjgF/YER057c/UK114 family)